MTINRTRGDTYPDVYTVSNASTGAVVNLTGSSFKLTLSSIPNPPDDSTQVYQLNGSVLAPTTGVVEFAPSGVQADRVGIFYYDIEMTDSFGVIRTLESGVYIYKQDITK